MTTIKHLWEIEHPYRCEFGNFYERGLHSHYGTAPRGTPPLPLFFIMQGRPYNQSVEVNVTEEDEPAVRAWLADRAETMRAMWEPFLG